MDFVKKHGLFVCCLISLAIGAVVFVSFFGLKVINPLNTDWLYESHIDMRLFYTGWHYFRNDPWGFPLGVFDGLSYPNKTTIYNTDSIPLFAIFFKLFRRFLPADFQYLGLSSVMGYMLQSLIGMLLIKKFTKDNIWGYLEAILAGIFFVLMPSFVIRTLNTSSFVFHWIILACFIPVIYKFKLKSNIIFYSAIGFLAAGINPYLLTICAIIIFTYCIYKFTFSKYFREFLPFILFCITSLFVLAMLGASYGMSQIGFMYLNESSLNLNGFLNSFDEMRFFGSQKTMYLQQGEGYAYFGIGITLLIILSLIQITRRFLKDEIDFKYKKEAVFISVLIFVSIFLALSPRITYSDIILFEIPYPDFIIDFLSVFRSIGRFVWIYNYVVLILVLIYFVTQTQTKKCLIILVCALLFQIYDFMPSENMQNSYYFNHRENIKTKTQFKSPYDDKTWDKLFDNNNIKYVFFDKSIYDGDYRICDVGCITDIGLYERNKGIKLNSFYYGRPVKGLDSAYSYELENPKDDDIFIFIGEKFDERLLTSTKLKHFYKFRYLYIARTAEIKGWEDFEIKKEDILQK